MDDLPMTDVRADDALHDLHSAEAAVVNALARDYAARRGGDPAFDPGAFFAQLRRLVEARADTLEAVLRDGPMGGGGPDEA